MPRTLGIRGVKVLQGGGEYDCKQREKVGEGGGWGGKTDRDRQLHGGGFVPKLVHLKKERKESNTVSPCKRGCMLDKL